jgi:glycosyltransferase involved in cell wall biosynthesis
MKIAIDISQIVYGTGVSVYTQNLTKALLKIDKDNDYLFFGGSFRRYDELKLKAEQFIDGSTNAKSLILPIAPSFSDIIFNRVGFVNIDSLIGKNDVFHSSDWVQPKTDSFTVTTIHDVVPLLYPSLTHPRITAVHRRRMERVKKYVMKIIVPSETTRNDLLKFGFNEKNIIVIPEAVGEEFKKPKKSDIQKILKKYRINDRYLLAVGTSPRKNIDRIISAFERVRVDKTLKLVVIGEVHHPVSVRNVVFLGHVPASNVPALYSGSDALIYPSLYEGFGLPVLEAYKLGVPVLTSNVGSLKEIGAASITVDPFSIDDISEGIKKLISDRGRYIAKGKEEIKKYTWEETAKKTLGVYNCCYE